MTVLGCFYQGGVVKWWSRWQEARPYPIHVVFPVGSRGGHGHDHVSAGNMEPPPEPEHEHEHEHEHAHVEIDTVGYPFQAERSTNGFLEPYQRVP